MNTDQKLVISSIKDNACITETTYAKLKEVYPHKYFPGFTGHRYTKQGTIRFQGKVPDLDTLEKICIFASDRNAHNFGGRIFQLDDTDFLITLYTD